MKRFLPLLLMFFTGSLLAQTTFDFETSSTILTFDGFGGAGAGTIANPDMSGNPSSTVLDLSKGAGAETWAGVVTNPGPEGGVYAEPGGQICMDVWMDHIGIISLKLEMEAFDNPANYRQEVANTTMNAWETICFDMDANSLDGDLTPAAGKSYLKIVIFPDFGTMGGAEAESYYIDNITVPALPSTIDCVTLYDYESPESSPGFFTFGGSLEGTITPQVPNPDVNTDNSSAGVMEYIKAGDAPTWGGASYTLDEPLNGTTLQEVCIKYWAPNTGNLTIKLELDDFQDPENWIGTVNYDDASTWQNLCFDVTMPSFEGNMNSAGGKVYPKLILFPDFGTAGSGTDVTYYMDDFVAKIDTAEQNYDVHFSVDMNEFAGDPFTGVFVNGTFNGWAGDTNPLSDDDGDGVWTGTYNLPAGAHEFKYTLDGWTQQEVFTGSEDCVISTDDGNGNIFHNRALTVTEETTLPAYCYNSCYACGQSVTITYNLGFDTAISVDPENVYVAGGTGFGVPGDNKMTDPDGDGIYSITLEKPIGFASHYTFINGDCFWDCKEDISGLECSDPDNFNDRFLDTLSSDITINTCFGTCATDTECGSSPTSEVTFNVDMNMETISAEGVFIAGEFTGWGDQPMTDDDGDGIYSYTVNLIADEWEWKFKNGTSGWEVFNDGDPCTITVIDGGNTFINRVTSFDGSEEQVVLDAYCFNSCNQCESSTGDVSFEESLFKVIPTVSATEFNIEFKTNDEKQIRLVDLSGKVVYSAKANTSLYTLNVTDYTQGVYMIQVISENQFKSQKVIITK